MDIECTTAMAIFLVTGFVLGIINERRREARRRERDAGSKQKRG